MNARFCMESCASIGNNKINVGGITVSGPPGAPKFVCLCGGVDDVTNTSGFAGERLEGLARFGWGKNGDW